MRVADICSLLERFAPGHIAEDWDNTGLLLGRTEAEVSKVMTCLTLTPDVADEAIEQDVQLIVPHHPILFRGIKQITSTTSEGEMLLKMIESGIAVYSPHTSFDNTAEGINQQWCRLLQLTNVTALRVRDSESGQVLIGRKGDLPVSTPLESVLRELMPQIGCRGLQYVGHNDQTVKSVAIACGAAGEFLRDALNAKCDLFVTGELRFHDALMARTAGIAVAVVGHYASERHAVEWLADYLDAKIDGVSCFASQVEADPLTTVCW